VKNIIIVLMLLVMLAISAVAWAQENRAFSDAQEVKIRKIINDFYPQGIKITMDDIGLGETRIICWAKYSEDYYIFTASANGNLKWDEVWPGSAYRTGIELEEKIAQVLKPPTLQ
jgi:hypothetical protein